MCRIEEVHAAEIFRTLQVFLASRKWIVDALVVTMVSSRTISSGFTQNDVLDLGVFYNASNNQINDLKSP